MQITRNMDLAALADRMGPGYDATSPSVMAMAGMLNDEHAGKRTSDVPPADWKRLKHAARHIPFVVIGAGYWGNGDTLAEALKGYAKAGGSKGAAKLLILRFPPACAGAHITNDGGAAWWGEGTYTREQTTYGAAKRLP